MRDTILKIAKCKDGAAFYKKFPTEESFMKVHGKEFKLAQAGLSDIGGMFSNGFTKGDIKGSSFGSIDKGGQLLGNVIQGIQGIIDEKQIRKQTQQTRAVSDVALQAARTRPEEYERQYVRPEDIENTGEEFFPIYGVGTNPIAQNGMQTVSKTDQHPHYIQKKGGQVQNTYEPYTIYDDLEYPTKQSGGSAYDQINKGVSAITDPFYGNSAGKDLGGTLGGAVGSIFGPAGNLIGTQVGKLAGWALDGNPRKIKKNQAATQRNIQGMNAINFGENMHQQYSAVAQEGLELYQDGADLEGQLQTHWGGEAETVSQNPYLPQGGQTVEFKGDMHNGSNIPGQSGIGITYGNSPVEVEGGETATVLEDNNGQENLTIYGNLKIPKGMLDDPDAKNKKFKNYIKDISDKEEKANKAVEKNLLEIDKINPITSFDKLKLSSHKANVLGNKMKLKDFADKKQDAANLQKAINDTAQEFGIVADDLARGNIKIDKGVFTPSNKTAQMGADLPVYNTAQYGKNLPPVAVDDYETIKALYEKAEASGNSADALEFQKTYHKLAPEYAQAIIASKPLTKYGKTHKLAKNLSSNEDGIFGERTKQYMAALRGKQSMSPVSEIIPRGMSNAPEAPGIPEYYHPENVKEEEDPNYLRAINSILPMFRPTDQSDFDNNQVMGEMFALSHNQVEGVQAQGYKPQLDVPYDISLQDQLNTITSQTRAGQRLAGYNPAAQSVMAGAAYDASTKVLGEQFRLNQAKKDQVYTGNRALLNDAQLKNLQIYDQQANRQSIARSNTKEAAQLALNSISDKYAKHKLENSRLGQYENLYNYRYGHNGRLQNMNELAEFDTNYDGNSSKDSTAEQIVKYQAALKKLQSTYKKESGRASAEDIVDGQNGRNVYRPITKMPLVKQLKHY